MIVILIIVFKSLEPSSAWIKNSAQQTIKIMMTRIRASGKNSGVSGSVNVCVSVSGVTVSVSGVIVSGVIVSGVNVSGVSGVRSNNRRRRLDLLLLLLPTLYMRQR